MPEAPGIGAAILGISGRVHEKHYDRGQRAAAGEAFLSALDKDREEARAYLRRLSALRPPSMADADVADEVPAAGDRP